MYTNQQGTPMSKSMRESLRAQRSRELQDSIDSKINALREEGYSVEFGTIGQRTTYVLICKIGTDEELVGYTYISGDLSRKNDLVGKSKALDQVITRKQARELANREIEVPDIPEV